jgi:cardiolipin synthase
MCIQNDNSDLRLLRAIVLQPEQMFFTTCTPEKPDVGIMRWAAGAFYGTLLKSLARVFEYKPSVLHAKIMIIDDWVTVGSSNMNQRSLIHDLEVDAVMTLPESKKEIYSQFLLDLDSSQEITYKSWATWPWWQKMFSQIALILKYWM